MGGKLRFRKHLSQADRVAYRERGLRKAGQPARGAAAHDLLA